MFACFQRFSRPRSFAHTASTNQRSATWKVDSNRSPGRNQQEQLRVQRAWRPHSLRCSEHEPKECAGSLLRRGRVPNVAFEWPLFAVGKRARPGKALKHLQGTVFSAEALSRPARPAFLLPFCCRRTPLVGSRCGQRSASSLPFCCRRTPLVSFLFLSAAGASAGSEAFVAGRSLWTFSAESYAQQVFEHSRPVQLGSIPGLSMPMCACVCHSLPLPGLSSLWVCCASCQDRLVRRGRVPNVTFESYIESRKLSVPRARPARTASRPARLEAALASPQRARTKGVRRQPAPPLESYRSPGRDQQEQLRVQRAWRPHSLRRSEHEPKECAGSLLRRGRVPHVAFGWPLFAVGKRARPGKALKHLQGTVFSAEALSRPARPAFLLPFCCRRTPLVGSRCGQRSASSLPFCSLWTFSAESYAQQVFEHSRPAQLRGSWCSGITPAQHARGAGFNPRPVHVRLRLSQFASP